ncbi:CHAT domain-containing protein [Brasilonema bromeliae]|uniref:CHAT domain-containing protein n=1 Tax=Brasilonema bromeliae SPC951 TaxID=385972 RepID=A0ABX1P2V3_9CYAN|nr:CHAT domain-containing protein [Brasilonema bromeliae]NMG18666.1 hypothetical protein [Brasilonema bromeliae SPC951]
MENFDLKIIPVNDHVAILAESNFGEATIQVAKKFFDEMADTSNDLRLLYSRLLRRSISRKSIESEVEKFGISLFNEIFKGEILSLLNRTIGGATDSQINLRLMLGQPMLNTIHWEVMRFRNEYIGFRHNLIRHPFVPKPVNIPGERREKLHILIVSVDPFSQRGKDVLDKEHETLVNMLKGFGEQIRISELRDERATVENIKDILFEGVDIFHFGGHGFLDSRNPMESSLIVWRSESSNNWNIPGREFGNLSIRLLTTLAANQSLGFCFLNACDTARSVETDTVEGMSSNNVDDILRGGANDFVNMAHNLIQAGVPIVLATNHAITFEAGYQLSKRFYTSVLKYGRRVDQAVKDARAELYIDANIQDAGSGFDTVAFGDWSCPVLYARSRQMEFGTKNLRWEPTLDIYTIRNVEKPPLALVGHNF